MSKRRRKLVEEYPDGLLLSAGPVSAQVAGRLSALEELATIMDRGKAEERLLKLERAKRWRRLPNAFAYWRCPCFDCEVY